MLKRIWQKSTLSYAVETGGRVCELQIVRVGITAFRAYLLVAAGEGATMAGQRGPRRQWPVAVERKQKSP